jgi:hypothetical protein
MGCGKSSLKHVCLLNIPDSVLLNIDEYEYDHLTYCTKCDIVGIRNIVLHCDICDRCHHISQYLHCTVCNMCLNPNCDRDYIRHRKLHNNL